MQMIAIKLTPENFPLISQQSRALDSECLKELYRDAQSLDETRYIIPNFISKFDVPFGSWVSVREDYFKDEFDFDATQIDTKFVDVNRK